MAAVSYLVVRNWKRFQHYKDRRPPWIKYYVELLDDTELRQLPLATRLLWDQLLLLAGRLDNVIPNDALEISSLTKIPQESVSKGIEQLLQGRWLNQKDTKPRASRPLARRKQDASPRARPRARREAEVEKEKSSSPKVERLPVNSARATELDLNELGKTLEQRIGAAPRGTDARLFEVLGDFDAESSRVVRPLLEKLPVAAIEYVREEVLAAENGKRTTGYAVQILKRMVEEQTVEKAS